MHETGRKGDIGVVATIADLLDKGFEVLSPISSVSPYDLIATDNIHFWKIQVKYVSEKCGRLQVFARRRVVNNRRIVGRKLGLSEVDVLAVYCPQRKCVYYLSMGTIGIGVNIRFEYPKNGLRKRIRLADKLVVFPPE